MLDTLKLIERLADLTAKYTHTNTPPPQMKVRYMKSRMMQ